MQIHPATREWLVRYNASLTMPSDERRSLLAERLAAVGAGSTIRPPFHCDYGFNLTVGSGVFLNFGCVVLDVVHVSIGDKTQIGPNVAVGDDAVIGAGSVVTRDVPAGATVIGNPARVRS